jgi:ABC-type glutathione transport system ATPase component
MNSKDKTQKGQTKMWMACLRFHFSAMNQEDLSAPPLIVITNHVSFSFSFSLCRSFWFHFSNRYAGTPPVTALHGLYLGVRSQECLGLLGPNGSGKSTSFQVEKERHLIIITIIIIF